MKLLRSLCVLVALRFVSNADAQDLSRSEIYYRTLHATAWVYGPNLNGTGWIIDRERRLVLTNRHIAENAEKAFAVFPIYKDGRVVADRSGYRVKEMKINGTVVHREPRRDLALIQLDRLPDDATQLKLAAASAPAGSTIHVVGNEGLAGCLWTYTPGTVARVWHMRQNVGGIGIDANVVTINAAFTAGDSGGPVVNDKGEAVAIISATGYSGGGRQFSGFCIDVTEIKSFLADAVKKLNEPDAKPAGEDNKGDATKAAEPKPFVLAKTAGGPPLSFDHLTKRTLRATAWVRSGSASGAGFLADAEKKLLVTSASLVDTEPVDVFFPHFKDDKAVRDRAAYQGDVKPIRGKVVERNPAADLAVVELEAVPDDASALKLAPAGPLAGEYLYLLTHPKGKSLWNERSALVRNGYHRKLAKSDLDAGVVLLNHSFADGDSGGPVVNKSGELVAVTSNRATNAPMLACCIDVDEVRAILAKATKKTETKKSQE